MIDPAQEIDDPRGFREGVVVILDHQGWELMQAREPPTMCGMPPAITPLSTEWIRSSSCSRNDCSSIRGWPTPLSTEAPRPVSFLWEANTDSARVVPAGGVAPARYDLSSLGPGSYTADLRLLFRSFPPHTLRQLEQKGELDPAVEDRVPLVEMERATVAFQVED